MAASTVWKSISSGDFTTDRSLFSSRRSAAVAAAIPAGDHMPNLAQGGRATPRGGGRGGRVVGGRREVALQVVRRPDGNGRHEGDRQKQGQRDLLEPRDAVAGSESILRA